MRFIVLLFLPVLSFSQSTLVKISLINSKVEVMVPKGLTKMTNEMWELKYHKKTQPVLVLSDKDAEVNLIGDYMQQPINDDQLAAFKDFQISALKKSHPDLVVNESGVRTINGKKVGYIKFISQAVDQKVFNYYFFTSLDEKLLLFTFNCIENLRKDWEKTADQVVESLKIK